jgi:hypothetical protein
MQNPSHAIISRDITIGFQWTTQEMTLSPDGTFTATSHSTTWQGPEVRGEWEIEGDGCVRIKQENSGMHPCYRFAQAGGNFEVHVDMPVQTGAVSFR